MIPRETIEQIAAANDIIDVIGSYFPLKRAGSAWKALCPFHQEKSPSFTVNPQRQRFHCFGCGEGGSVFDFVSKYENTDFITAVRRLAERANIRIIEEERSPGEDRAILLRKRLLALHLAAADWFHDLLLNSPEAKSARNYLKKRGLNSEIAGRWKIGYAPESWDDFIGWAREHEYQRDEIVQSGLVSMKNAENPDSDFYDRFRDRVMFPICNDLGEVIGFSGRVLAAEAQGAKYVNSPETPIFKKGDVLFGLHKSKRALIEKKSAIVLEGQIDLITAFEAGVQNVVAPQGTAFTEKQARTLKRYAEEVILCFDADTAGQKAAEKSLPSLLGLDLGVRVIELPPGEDPDSLIRGQGAGAFVERVEAARDYFDFQIDVQSGNPEFTTPRGKVKAARAIAANIQLISDRLLREAVAGRVSTRLGIPLADFWNLLDRSGKSAPRPQPGQAAPAESKSQSIQPLVATQPINALTLLALGDPEIRRWINAQPWSPQLLEMEGTELLMKILDSGESELCLDQPATITGFSAGLDDESKALLNALLRESVPGETAERIAVAQDCWNAIVKRDLLHRREALLARLRDPGLSAGEETEIMKKIFDLQQLITDISRPFSPPGSE